MFQMLNIILFIIPLLAAAEDYYQLLGVKKVANELIITTFQTSVPSLNSSIFSLYVSLWHCCQISKHAYHVSTMFNCSATPNTFDANNRVTRKCKPWPDLLPTSETRSELCKSFYFCSLRMLTTGRSERRSRSWLWSCTRTRTTPRLNFWRFKFQVYENAGISWILWF